MEKVRSKRSALNQQQSIKEENNLIKTNVSDDIFDNEIDYHRTKRSILHKWKKPNDSCFSNNDTLAKVFYLI